MPTARPLRPSKPKRDRHASTDVGSQDDTILATNVAAIEALYVAAMLEEMRMFEVVDQIVSLFARGLLPISKGPAADALYQRWKDRGDTLDDEQRRNLYARAFGFAAANDDDETDVVPNRKFQTFWLRFLTAVADYQRQCASEPSPPQDPPPPIVSGETVRTSGRDLAVNLSTHGAGIVASAARDIRDQTRQAVGLLAMPEIRNAFGARDLWQVVDRVARTHLGGDVNVVRLRARAESGSSIIRWLATNRARLVRVTPALVLKLRCIETKNTKDGRRRKGTQPDDSDLAAACESWLASQP